MGFGIEMTDERLHAPTADPGWRESFWLDAYDERRDVGVLIYAHARPAAAAGDLLVAVVGPHGQLTVHDSHGLAYHGPHVDDALDVGGLHVEYAVPGRSVRADVALPQISLSLVFDATAPIYDYDWESWTSSRHYEQFGRVEGNVATGRGKPVPFRGSATRDHAWGARGGRVSWDRMYWITARFGDGAGWGLCLMDMAESQLLGYLMGESPAEVVHAVAAIQFDEAAKVVEADVQLRAADGREQRARLAPIAGIDRGGADKTKPGSYDYYFVRIEDDRHGRGWGVLDVLAAPGVDLSKSGALEIDAP